MASARDVRAHEEHRWSYMNHNQLRTRLGRMRKPEKLQEFARMASSTGAMDLYEACQERIRYLDLATIRATPSFGSHNATMSIPINSGRQVDVPFIPKKQKKPKPKKVAVRKLIF
jgi:hypothetical protein